MKYMFILLILVVNFCNIKFTNACYFTNCPWGGKRSEIEHPKRACLKCANGLGMCFGPRICCGPTIGCLIDTKVSRVCESEDKMYATPCYPYGKTCTSVNYGKCATKDLCCNPESCILDKTCDSSDDIEIKKQNDYDDDDGLQLDDEKSKEALKSLVSYLLHHKISHKNRNDENR